jgi:heme exporter protein A
MTDQFSAEDLLCIRGERIVFTNLEFKLDGGGAMVLRGPNGSGKSSLLRLMAGLGRPVEGALRWNGDDVRNDFTAHRARSVYVGHSDGVKTALTVRENLAFWAGLGHNGNRMQDAIDRMALSALADVAGRFLSAGEKRRLALARLLVRNAPLWLLDEPTVGLDSGAQDIFESLLADHCAGGGMVVLSTHTPIRLEPAQEVRLGDFAVARMNLEAAGA